MNLILYITLVISLLAQIPCRASSYDNALRFMYSNNKPSLDLLERKARNVSKNIDLDLKLLRRWHFAADVPIVRNMSHKSIDGNDVIGHFFVFELNKDYEPFTVLFDCTHGGAAENEDMVPMWMQYLDLTNCEVLELFDVKLHCRELSNLRRIRGVRFLGLPNRGMTFDCDFSLPEDLELLVVRNSVLNERFFSALKELDSLKRLMLFECTLQFPPPAPSGWTYDESSWSDQHRIFSKIGSRLESIEIRRSDPNIFNYMLSEKWPRLSNIDIDILSHNKIALTYLGDRNKGHDSPFPALTSVRLVSIPQIQDRINRAFKRDGVELILESKRGKQDP
jgi:hypothetical protein